MSHVAANHDAPGGGGGPSSASANLATTAAAFAENPVAYLETIASRPPSRENLSLLAGTVAASIKDNATIITGDPRIAALYLQASARQLVVESKATAAAATSFLPNGSHSSTSAAAAAAVAIAVANQQQLQVVESDNMNMMQSTKEVYEITEAIGYAVTRCSPRSFIVQSGILPVLESLLPTSSSASSMQSSMRNMTLSNVHVEFLQACLYAEQYRYAERLVADTWPRPTSTVSVRQVLRYYYLRGTIHMGSNNNWKMAVRCFWTCLVVPCEIVSAIAIAAWKKLVLVRCLMLSDQPILPPMTATAADSSSRGSTSSSVSPPGPLQLPKATPACLTRFLSAASNPPPSSKTSSPSAPSISSPPGHHHHHHRHQQRSPVPEPEVEDPEAMHVVELETFSETEAGGASPQQQQQQRAGTNAAPLSYPSFGVKVYMDLVQAFCRTDRQSFFSILQEHEALFTSDGNLGMVHQVAKEFIRRQVYVFSRVYSVISLDQLASFLEISSDKVQVLLLQLSMDKAWSIQISNDGVVYFPKLPPPAASADDDGIDVKELMELTKMVQKLDVAIASSAKYAAFCKKKGRSGSSKEARAAAPRGVEDV